jgi:hypothetical protein
MKWCNRLSPWAPLALASMSWNWRPFVTDDIPSRRSENVADSVDICPVTSIARRTVQTDRPQRGGKSLSLDPRRQLTRVRGDRDGDPMRVIAQTGQKIVRPCKGSPFGMAVELAGRPEVILR